MPNVLLIGEGDLAEETRQALDAAGADVYRMKSPEEREVRHALEGDGIDRVVVVSREDAVVLRTALMVRDVDENVPMLVTIFEPDDGRAGRPASSSTARSPRWPTSSRRRWPARAWQRT